MRCYFCRFVQDLHVTGGVQLGILTTLYCMCLIPYINLAAVLHMTRERHRILRLCGRNAFICDLAFVAAACGISYAFCNQIRCEQ